MALTLDAETLANHLEQGHELAPFYLVCGSEPLLINEALDRLRTTARANGYTNRRSFTMDVRSDWSSMVATTKNISLFGDKPLIELKLATGKPGKTGQEALVNLAETFEKQRSIDSLMVLLLPKLDKTIRESKWLQALAHHGIVLNVNTVQRSHLPTWMRERLMQQKQQVDDATLYWITEKVEGNLLAAHQEIQKLALLYPEGSLTDEQVKQAVLDVARYDIYDLRDAMLFGKTDRTIRIINGLKAEGTALPLLLWVIGEEIRILARLAYAQESGQDVSSLMRKLRVFGTHANQTLQVLAQTPASIWPAAVENVHEIDRLIKGLKVAGRLDDPWEEIIQFALRIASRGEVK